MSLPNVRRDVRSLLRGRPALSPELTDALLENLADPVVACDAEGTLVVFNRKARELLRAPPAAPSQPERWAAQYGLYHRDGARLVATDELPLIRALRGEEVRDTHIESRGKGGARVVLNVSGGAVRDERGEIQGAVIVMQDVTERVAIEDQLRLQSAVVANIGAGVALVRARDGLIVYSNEQWDLMFGYRSGELVGRHISVVNAPTDQMPEERTQAIFEA